jgi:hypothetical protein
VLYPSFGTLPGWLGVALTGSGSATKALSWATSIALACLVGVLVMLQAYVFTGMIVR